MLYEEVCVDLGLPFQYSLEEESEMFIEAKVIDNNRVEITKVHNINDSDNIYSLLNFARNTLFFIIILVLIISIFL
jgi:hypothetical protein